MNKYDLDARGLACPLPVIKTKKLLDDFDVVETRVDNEIATQNLQKLASQLGLDIEVKKISETEYKTTISKKDKPAHTIVDTLNDTCIIPVTQARRVLEKEKIVELIVKNESDVLKLEDFANKFEYLFEKRIENDNFHITIKRDEINNAPCETTNKDDSYIVVINKNIMGHGSEELGSSLMKAYLYALGEQEVLPSKIIFYNNGSILVDKNRSNVLEELFELEKNGVEIVCCGACIDYNKIDLAVGNPTNMYFIVEDMRKANKIVRP